MMVAQAWVGGRAGRERKRERERERERGVTPGGRELGDLSAPETSASPRV